jgi:hypothetical protein
MASYREAAILGRALKPDEVAYVSEMIRRIAAILLLSPGLDANYGASDGQVFKRIRSILLSGKKSNRVSADQTIHRVLSAILEVRYHEVVESVAKPFSRVGVNYLSKDDIAAFKVLCDRAGSRLLVWPPLSRPLKCGIFCLSYSKAKI